MPQTSLKEDELPELLSATDLAAAFARSRTDCQTKWAVVDQELYELCRRQPSQQDFGDVYAKVMIIGRVYAAGISRSSPAEDDREAAVAQGIVQQAAEIDAVLETLASAQFNREAAARIVEFHAQTTRGLKQHTGDRWLQSFVSKYLHFHCDLVPVFDSQAELHVGGFVDWTSVYRIREAIGRPSDWLTRYYNFVTAFLALSERVTAETGPGRPSRRLTICCGGPSNIGAVWIPAIGRTRYDGLVPRK